MPNDNALDDAVAAAWGMPRATSCNVSPSPTCSLVDMLADVKEQQRKLKQEEDALYEAITAQAGLTPDGVLHGTNMNAVVRVERVIQFPRKEEEPNDYQALNEMLRRSPHWPICSALDRYALQRHLKDGCAADLRQLLERFAQEVEKVSVKLLVRR